MKILFTISLFLLTFFAQAQEKRTGIGLSYGFGYGGIFHLQKRDGSGSNQGNSLNTLGINYWQETLKNLHLEIGVQYLVYKYTATAPYYGQYPPVVSNHKVKLITIPIQLRYDLGKFIFFNGGLNLNLDAQEINVFKDYKFGGIGAGAGIGLQYYFKNKMGIYINPRLDLRNVISFSNEGSNVNLATALLTFGLNYRIK